MFSSGFLIGGSTYTSSEEFQGLGLKYLAKGYEESWSVVCNARTLEVKPGPIASPLSPTASCGIGCTTSSHWHLIPIYAQ